MPRSTTSIPVNVIKAPKPAPQQSPAPEVPPKNEPPRPQSLQRRQHLMWWIVGLGTVGALAIWIWLWPIQMGRTSRDTTIDRIVNIFHLPIKQESEGEKEIRALDKEVFPQFQ